MRFTNDSTYRSHRATAQFARRKAAARAGRRCRPTLEELEPRVLLSGFQPTGVEQLFLEDLNAARANPTAYGQSIGVDLSYIAPSQPLAFSPQLIQAALLHSQDMNDRAYFAHDTPDGITPDQRVAAADYSGAFAGESIAGGSIFANPATTLASLITDSGVPSLGHRDQLLSVPPYSQSQSEVGVGVVLGGSGPLTTYYTIDTGVPTDSRPFITGVVFHDDNGNGQYGIGEGFANAAVTVQGVGVTETFDSGGYAMQVNPGTYTVTVSGGGLEAPITHTVTVGDSNVALNFIGPAEGSWSTQAALSAASSALAVVAGADGRIYALGGADAHNHPLATLEAYTPSNNSWTTLASMPTPRDSLAATLGQDGRIYAFGGQDAFQNPLATAEVYDPTSNTWSSLPAMPDARTSAAAVTGAAGRLYILGGAGTNGFTTTVDVYSPKTKNWSTVAELPTVRVGLAAVLGSDGHIYALGGANVNDQPLGTVEVYDPTANAWTTAAAMPQPRAFFAAANGPDGRIYVLGGDGEDGTLGAAVEVYTPAGDTWNTLADLPNPRSDLGAAVGSDGLIYAVGGFNGSVSGAVEALTVPLEFAFAASAYPVAEGTSSVTITVLRTGSVSGTAAVQYAVSPGTATPGVDYTPVTGTLSFTAGQTSQQFTVLLADDGGTGEPDETIDLTLSNPTGGARLANPPSATILLIENDSGGSTPPGGSPPPAPGGSTPPGRSPPAPPAPPTLHVPPLLAFVDSLLGAIETVNGNGTETVTDSIFGIQLFVSTFDGSGNLMNVSLFSFNVTFFFV